MRANAPRKSRDAQVVQGDSKQLIWPVTWVARACDVQIARYNDKQLIRSVTWTSRDAPIARHDYEQLIRLVTLALCGARATVGIWLCGMSRKLIVSLYERMTYRTVAYKAIESLSNFASLFDVYTHLYVTNVPRLWQECKKIKILLNHVVSCSITFQPIISIKDEINTFFSRNSNVTIIYCNNCKIILFIIIISKIRNISFIFNKYVRYMYV